MDAWILHIRDEWLNDENVLRHQDTYSAWLSEQQAMTAAAAFLRRRCQQEYLWPGALRTAVPCLLEGEHTAEAIALVNECTQVSPPPHNGIFGARKTILTIKQSKFQGSPFE